MDNTDNQQPPNKKRGRGRPPKIEQLAKVNHKVDQYFAKKKPSNTSPQVQTTLSAEDVGMESARRDE